MKTISLKKFRKSKEEMSAQAYTDKMGFPREDINSDKVLVYLGHVAIEVHEEEVVGELPKPLFMVYWGGGDLETESLQEAEEFLYKGMKSEGSLPTKEEKEKKEKVDPKMCPRGLNSYLETLFQITEVIGNLQSRYKEGQLVWKGNDIVDELDGQCGKQGFAQESATEFETKYIGVCFGDDGVRDYFDAIDEFLEEKFTPKKTYRVISKKTIDCMVEVKARSPEEAQRLISQKTADDYSDLVGSEDFEEGEIKEM